MCFRCGLLGGVGGHGRLRSAVHSPECESGVHTECSVLSFILVKDAFIAKCGKFPSFSYVERDLGSSGRQNTLLSRDAPMRGSVGRDTELESTAGFDAGLESGCDNRCPYSKHTDS